ncbi:hypothetical protein LX36DRAFT_579835 [Colletotrichum falcatum]|nr:hypothetical protein LX36DRAFT_579835 [Colletotrichum falcatum]
MVSVTITYKKPGTQPPIFVAGSFSDPQWQPQEMQFTTEDGGEHTFHKNIEVPPCSQIQYKFRVGQGDWWVLNEDAPTVTDASGNRNNILIAPEPHEDKQPNGDNGQTSFEAPGIMDASNSAAASAATQPEPKPKAVDHLKDEERQRLSSTPIEKVADTAAEVADSAAKLDAEEDTTYPELPSKGVSQLKDEERKRLSSTPIEKVADTAAEVADSAARLDAEEDTTRPEPLSRGVDRLKDEERRSLSSTPVDQVASVAAEVADSAQALDADKYSEDMDNVDDGSTPLFAHEALGPYESSGSDEDDASKGLDHHGIVDYDVDKYDLNDPTLERWPSNRSGIIDAVRKVETGLNEDQTSFHGAPLSPIIGSRKAGLDQYYEEAVLSSGPSSPTSNKRLELPRRSNGSMVSDRSLLSLVSIAEEDKETPTAEEADFDDDGMVRVPSPAVRPTPSALTSPASDEDEGVVMKGSKAKSWKSSESARSESPHLNGESNGKHAMDDESPEAPLAQPDGPKAPVETAEHIGEPGNAEDNNQTRSVDFDAGGSASTTGRDDGHKGQIKKRGASPAERPSTPSSIHSVTGSKGGWLQAFFRVLFVDWIGGLFSRMFGSRRQAMLVTSTAAVVVGAAWWKLAMRGDLS